MLILDYLELEGQQQHLRNLKNKLNENKEEMKRIVKKKEFYNYLKEEEKVEEKREMINDKTSNLKSLDKQKQELNEKSRVLVDYIQIMSRTMVRGILF